MFHNSLLMKRAFNNVSHILKEYFCKLSFIQGLEINSVIDKMQTTPIS